jgi:hypothetical protein
VLPLGDLEVVEVMGRGNFEGAGAELRGDVGVGNEGDLSAQDREA